MFAQYGMHQDGAQPSQEMTDALVNAILDEELSKNQEAAADFVPVQGEYEPQIPPQPEEPAEEFYGEEYPDDDMRKKKKKKRTKILP